jgi:hypothetical protein
VGAALRVPKSQLKTVSTIVGTMTKLNFFDAVLNRLARAEHGSGDVGRGVFFVADEYDGYTTQPGDGDFFSKCREAKCCAVIATQTYESFVAKLKNEHVAAQLIANLRTKIWLCAEDNFTARQAADLCGEIERKKVSRSRNESARHSAFSFLDGDVIAADPGSVGEGITISLRREHLFTPRAFTSLKVNQAIVKLFDGVRVLEPWVVYLKPMHENPEVSWFDTTGREAEEPAAERPRLRTTGLGSFRRLVGAVPRHLRRRHTVAAVTAEQASPKPNPQEGSELRADAAEKVPEGSHVSHP